MKNKMPRVNIVINLNLLRSVFSKKVRLSFLSSYTRSGGF